MADSDSTDKTRLDFASLTKEKATLVRRQYQKCCSNSVLSELKSLIECYGLPLVEAIGVNFVKTASVAAVILESIPTEKQENFIFNSKLFFYLNPLHRASSKGNTDLVRFWLSTGYFTGKKLFAKDDKGDCALHHSDNTEIFVALLEAYSKESSIQISQCIDDRLLSKVCENGKTEIVKYITTNHPERAKQIMLKWHQEGISASRLASSGKVTQMLLNMCTSDEKIDMLRQTDSEGRSALHLASDKGQIGVVVTLLEYGKELNIADKMVMQKDGTGCTPLFYGCEQWMGTTIAHLLISAISQERRKDLLTSSDNEGRNILHQIACNFIGSAKLAGTVILARFMFRELIEYLVSPDTLEDVLMHPDDSGNTPLMLAVDFGKLSMVNDILLFFEAQVHREAMLKALIEHRNTHRQNIFHLTIINPMCDMLLDLIVQFSHYADAPSIYEPDVYGNSPLTYLAGRYMTEPFAVGLMKLSLPHRKRIMFTNNKSGKNCIMILHKNDHDKAFFLDSILCGNDHVKFGGNDSSTFYHSKNQSTVYNFNFLQSSYDERIWIVLRYALNEYDITFSVSISSPTADNKPTKPLESANEVQKPIAAAATQSATDETTESIQGTKRLQILFIDENDTSLSKARIRKQLYDLDKEDRHGMPKVVIRNVPTNMDTFSFPPPGPDFMILTLFYNDAEPKGSDALSQRVREHLSHSTSNNVKEIIDQLKELEDVERVGVNSTLARHTSLGDQLCSGDNPDTSQSYHIVRRDAKKRALIVYYTKDRDEWEYQYKDCVKLLKHKLGFEVGELKDIGKDSLLKHISEFAREDTAYLYALVIMAHGDLNGNVSDVNSEPISVQSVIDAFCHGTLTPKIVLLSFCRGELPKGNRTLSSPECQILPGILDKSEFSPSKDPLNKKSKVKEWRKHPFPDVIVPTSCHVMYSTLPDSKAPRRQCLFGVMCEHIDDIIASVDGAQLVKVMSINEEKPESLQLHSTSQEFGGARPKVTLKLQPARRSDATPVERKMATIHHDKGVTTGKHAPSMPTTGDINIDLLEAFVDVSALVRERSGFTQYTNHCYAVDKSSQRLLIQIPPH